MSNQEWKFDQTENTAAITTPGVMNGEDIVTVIHYSEDHSWAFLCANADPETSIVVSMKAVVEKHPDIQEIAELEPGYMLNRQNAEAEWIIQKEPL